MGASSGIVPFAKTDEQGHYCLKGLWLGDYLMTADDPGKGYPNMATGFFSSERTHSQVQLTATNLNGTVDWKIPYKAAFVKADLVDAQTGKQVDAMFFDLLVQSRPEVGHMFGSAGSATPLLLPPNEDVIVTITAPGYRKETDQEPQRTVLNLSPGQTKLLHIELQPLSVVR